MSYSYKLCSTSFMFLQIPQVDQFVLINEDVVCLLPFLTSTSPKARNSIESLDFVACEYHFQI